MGKLREKAAEYHEEFAARIINGPRSGDGAVAEALTALRREIEQQGD